MFQRLINLLFATTLLVAASPLAAQIVGSPYETQFSELLLEGRVPLTNIFAANPSSLALPPEVLSQIQAGRLELRGRLEFNRAARVVRLWQFIVPAATPLPSPQSPAVDAPNVAVCTDLHIESIRWHHFSLDSTAKLRYVVAIIGRTIGKFTRIGPSEGETGSISFGFEDADPSKTNFLTVHYPGEITAVIPQVAGTVRLEPAKLRAPL